jgi:hypothetical protein
VEDGLEFDGDCLRSGVIPRVLAWMDFKESWSFEQEHEVHNWTLKCGKNGAWSAAWIEFPFVSKVR